VNRRRGRSVPFGLFIFGEGDVACMSNRCGALKGVDAAIWW